MKRLKLSDLPLPGLKLIQRKVIGDQRGFLCRLFCANELAAAGWIKPVAQINHTLTSKRGTVRGMHYQHPPHAEMKLVSCLRGKIFDVAVDLRQGSHTFLQWHGEVLSEENHHTLLIPEGFAHGFQALTDSVELLYVHSAPYVAASEAGLQPEEPRLGITWPLDVAEISARDSGHSLLTEAFRGIVV